MFFFFNDTATTEIYTLSLHDALPIYPLAQRLSIHPFPRQMRLCGLHHHAHLLERSEEHTSELQSHLNLVCRLLLEKKKSTWRLRSSVPGKTYYPLLLVATSDSFAYFC